jgi:UDP-N-acetyl-D-glucosamine dehydrogenase
MKVAIIGQGYVGLPIAISAAEAGHNVGGFDINSSKINNLKKGISDSPDVSPEKIIELQHQKKIFFSDKIEDHEQSTIFVIAVPTPLDDNLKPELKYLISACELLAKIVKPGDLIINESTSYIGTLNDLIKPTIENLSGIKEIDFVVAPERIDPGNKNWNIRNTPRILAGLTIQATDRAVKFYESFCNNVIAVSNPHVAEAAKLLENTFRQVNIALINEFSEVARQFDISAHETVLAAATKPYGFMPFYPSIGVGGHCIPIDPTYLIYSANRVNKSTEIVALSNKINLSMLKKTVSRIKLELGGSIVDRRIQIAGITYKPNIADVRESPALLLFRELEDLGADVIYSDPFIAKFNGRESQPLSLNIDLGLIVTPHDVFDFSIWKKSNSKVFDLSATSKNYGWPKYL